VLNTVIHLMNAILLLRSYYYHTHFTDVKTKALGS
jgi:hypothetical protein